MSLHKSFPHLTPAIITTLFIVTLFYLALSFCLFHLQIRFLTYFRWKLLILLYCSCYQISDSCYSPVRAINITAFCHDILRLSFTLKFTIVTNVNIATHPHSTLSDFVDCYNSTLSQLLNKHAPLKSEIIRTKPRNHWFIQALNILELTKRHLERIWSRTHSSEDLKNLHSSTDHYHAAIVNAKRTYIYIGLYTLLLFDPVLLILVNFGKISLYFFIALLCMLYLLGTL